MLVRIPRLRRPGGSKLEQDPHLHGAVLLDDEPKVEAPKEHPWSMLVPRKFPVLRGRRTEERRPLAVSAWRQQRKGTSKREAKLAAYPARQRRFRKLHGRPRGRR